MNLDPRRPITERVKAYRTMLFDRWVTLDVFPSTSVLVSGSGQLIGVNFVGEIN